MWNFGWRAVQSGLMTRLSGAISWGRKVLGVPSAAERQAAAIQAAEKAGGEVMRNGGTPRDGFIAAGQASAAELAKTVGAKIAAGGVFLTAAGVGGAYAVSNIRHEWAQGTSSNLKADAEMTPQHVLAKKVADGTATQPEIQQYQDNLKRMEDTKKSVQDAEVARLQLQAANSTQAVLAKKMKDGTANQYDIQQYANNAEIAARSRVQEASDATKNMNVMKELRERGLTLEQANKLIQTNDPQGRLDGLLPDQLSVISDLASKAPQAITNDITAKLAPYQQGMQLVGNGVQALGNVLSTAVSAAIWGTIAYFGLKWAKTTEWAKDKPMVGTLSNMMDTIVDRIGSLLKGVDIGKTIDDATAQAKKLVKGGEEEKEEKLNDPQNFMNDGSGRLRKADATSGAANSNQLADARAPAPHSNRTGAAYDTLETPTTDPTLLAATGFDKPVQVAAFAAEEPPAPKVRGRAPRIGEGAQTLENVTG